MPRRPKKRAPLPAPPPASLPTPPPTVAGLYARPYTNYTLCQSSEVHFASASSYLEPSQPLFEPLHIPCEYIPPITTMAKMGLGETIASTPCHTHEEKVAERALER
jgi:hypothetical protein